MTALEALILGIIQGVTEFLPISSSGHLKLAQYFLGIQNLEEFILFDLACHLGTLLTILIVFYRSILNVFDASERLWQILVAIIPLFPLLLVMKPIKALYGSPHYLGFFFLLTALILFLGAFFAKKESAKPSLKGAFVVGLWQALAILPGVSRSGSTITGARLLGWNIQEAIAFSFLLAIPTILGGTLLEILKLWRKPDLMENISLMNYGIGFLFSFLAGYIALKLLLKIATHNKFFYFAWYCLLIGLAITIYFHL